MTYVLAWKTASSVYVHADSVVTIEGENLPPSVGTTSNFGETHVARDGILIEERIFKLRQIGNRYLFGFAGLVSLASEIIKCFESELDRDRTRWTADVFNAAISMVLQPHTRGEVQIILGVVDENGSELFVYNGNGSQRVQLVETVVHIGSLVTDRPHISDTIFRYILNVARPHENCHSLHVVNAYMQSFVLHNGLMELGVGGLIAGAKLTRHELQWPADTIYLFYNGPEFHITGKLVVYYRHGGVNIFNFSNDLSTPTRNIDGFYSTSDGNELQKIGEMIGEIDLTTVINNHDYVVFLSAYWQQAVVVPRTTNNDPELCKIEASIEGKILRNDIQIHQPLLKILAKQFEEFKCLVLVKDPDE